MKIPIKFLLLFAAFCTLTLASCFALPYEAPLPPPPRLAEPPEILFTTTPVARGDVELTASPPAVYVPAMVETAMFSRNNIPIEGIFVAMGDEVMEGDIIASLYSPETLRELEDLEQRLSRAEIELQILRDRRSLALDIATGTERAVDESDIVRQINNIQTETGLLRRQIEYSRNRVEELQLRAPIDGVVTTVAVFVEGMVSTTTQIIATITNQNYTSFVVRGHHASHMQPGDRFEMEMDFDMFLMEVIDPEEYGLRANHQIAPAGMATEALEVFEAFLTFVDSPPTLRLGMTGRILMPFESVEDVLYIPLNILHTTEERTFVYVVESGIRTVRDVTIGLEGNTYVEIVGGLSEGELVTR